MKKFVVYLATLVVVTGGFFATPALAGNSTDVIPPSEQTPGEYLADQPGFAEFEGRSKEDLLARLIYSEAMGESLDGKRGVAHVVRNRVNKNRVEFGGSTYEGVILKTVGGFDGMTTIYARQPIVNSQAWVDSYHIAVNLATQPNPIGYCLWFNTHEIYGSRMFPLQGVDHYTFDGGATYKKVVEKKIIGKHTFFRVEGY